MLEGRQDLPLITTFCLHLVDGQAAEMVEPLAEAHQRGAKWTLDAYARGTRLSRAHGDARAVARYAPVRPDFLYELAMTWRALAGMLLDDRERMIDGLRHAQAVRRPHRGRGHRRGGAVAGRADARRPGPAAGSPTR